MVSRAAPRSAARVSRKASIRRSVIDESAVLMISAGAPGDGSREPGASSLRKAVIRNHLLNRFRRHRKIAKGQIEQAAEDRQRDDGRENDPQLPAPHSPARTPSTTARSVTPPPRRFPGLAD